MSTAEAQPPAYGSYDVEYPLGRGAMGMVYLARERRIGRRVALKTIQLSSQLFAEESTANEFFLRLQREAEVCGSLLHPNIVTLYEAGYEGQRISFLAMELVEGETLQALMKRHGPGPVPVETALRVGEDVLRGLNHAHAKGIVHRDIKPANVLIAADGTAKIADFGIARPQDSSMTGAGALIGTPKYMSPEQVLGKALTPRADLFSLGVVLYEMTTAQKPFVGPDITAILHNILRQEVPNASDVNPAVPRGVGDLIARLMAKSPDARPTADQALDEIRALRGSDTLRSRFERVRAWRRSLRPRHAAIIVAAAVLLTAIPLFVIGSRIDSSPTVSIPSDHIAEFVAKRRSLDDARQAFEAGRYEESLLKYEAFLQKYPDSASAREGRDRSREALDAQAAAAEQDPQVASKKPAPRPSQKKKDEDIPPSELLKRIKKIFRR